MRRRRATIGLFWRYRKDSNVTDISIDGFALLDACKTSCMLLDDSGNILHVNRQLRNMLATATPATAWTQSAVIRITR